MNGKQNSRLMDVQEAARAFVAVLAAQPDGTVAGPDDDNGDSLLMTVAEAAAETLWSAGVRVWFPHEADDADGKTRAYDFLCEEDDDRAERIRRLIEKAVPVVGKEGGYSYDAEHAMFTREIEAPAGDALTMSEISGILADDCPEHAFFDAVEEHLGAVARVNAIIGAENDVLSVMQELDPEFLSDPDVRSEAEAAVEDWMIGALDVSCPYRHYERQPLDVDVVIDTGDGNGGYTANAGFADHGLDAAWGTEKASVLWLAKTQGFDPSDVSAAVSAWKDAAACWKQPEETAAVFMGSNFLYTLGRELSDLPGREGQLTVCVRMELGKLLELTGSSSSRELQVTPLAAIGLHAPTTGEDSDFGIALDCKFRLPLRYARAIPDALTGKYSVREVHEAEFWKYGVVWLAKQAEDAGD